MASDLLSTVRSYFSNDLINKAASYLGETESSVRKGLDAVIPLSLAGVVQKAESSPETLLNLAHEAEGSNLASDLANSFRTGGQGIPTGAPSLIGNIFGDKFGSIANAISSFTGVKGSTSSSLIGTILPLIMGLLGKQATADNLSPRGLSSWLGSQKNAILAALPSGLNISRLIGLGDLSSVRNTTAASIPEKKRSNWVLPLILGAAVLALLLWLMNSGKKTPTPAAVVATDTTSAVPRPGPIGLRSLKLTLPNGVQLDAYEGGIEDRLLAFIKDPNAKPGKETWFDFRELNFEFGTANIVPESRNELDNIVKILQAYPNVKIKIGGYTDKVGDEANNLKLSQGRANAVADALKSAGVGKQVTGAEGYGSQFAKFPADAPESDRINDRHVSVSVRSK